MPNGVEVDELGLEGDRGRLLLRRGAEEPCDCEGNGEDCKGRVWNERRVFLSAGILMLTILSGWLDVLLPKSGRYELSTLIRTS